MHMCMYVHIYIYMHYTPYVYVSVYIPIYICIYIYRYLEKIHVLVMLQVSVPRVNSRTFAHGCGSVATLCRALKDFGSDAGLPTSCCTASGQAERT